MLLSVLYLIVDSLERVDPHSSLRYMILRPTILN